MINTSKLAFAAVVALTSIASPAFAHTIVHRHHHHRYRRVYNYQPDPRPTPVIDPVDDPAMTGGGSAGYNACAGHPRC
jgi:hypothetical protein